MYRWDLFRFSVRTDDRDILINGYNIIPADHPRDNKRGCVYIYYPESLVVQLAKINYPSECLLCQVLVILIRDQIIDGKAILKQVRIANWLSHNFLWFPTINIRTNHILKNSFSCINLIFIDQPTLITNSGTHHSLHPSCHYNITFFKINLKIPYPSPYRRLAWDFKRANISSIRKAIKMVDWQFMFLNKNTHEQVVIFKDILMNIFC